MSPPSSSSPLPLVLLTLVGVGCGTRPIDPPSLPSPAANTVTAEDVQRNAPDQAIEKALAGRVAGVIVDRAPDGSIAVRIRGASSLYGNNEPLYVLDGMAIQAGPNGALTGINPSDIESIRVLKEPAETSMYGARGANGVIIIKTKRPKKPHQR